MDYSGYDGSTAFPGGQPPAPGPASDSQNDAAMNEDEAAAEPQPPAYDQMTAANETFAMPSQENTGDEDTYGLKRDADHNSPASAPPMKKRFVEMTFAPPVLPVGATGACETADAGGFQGTDTFEPQYAEAAPAERATVSRVIETGVFGGSYTFNTQTESANVLVDNGAVKTTITFEPQPTKVEPDEKVKAAEAVDAGAFDDDVTNTFEPQHDEVRSTEEVATHDGVNTDADTVEKGVELADAFESQPEEPTPAEEVKTTDGGNAEATESFESQPIEAKPFETETSTADGAVEKGVELADAFESQPEEPTHIKEVKTTDGGNAEATESFESQPIEAKPFETETSTADGSAEKGVELADTFESQTEEPTPIEEVKTTDVGNTEAMESFESQPNEEKPFETETVTADTEFEKGVELADAFESQPEEPNHAKEIKPSNGVNSENAQSFESQFEEAVPLEREKADDAADMGVELADTFESQPEERIHAEESNGAVPGNEVKVEGTENPEEEPTAVTATQDTDIADVEGVTNTSMDMDQLKEGKDIKEDIETKSEAKDQTAKILDPDAEPPKPLLIGTLAYSDEGGINFHTIIGRWAFDNLPDSQYQRFELRRRLQVDEELKSLPADGVFHGSFDIQYPDDVDGETVLKSRSVEEYEVQLHFSKLDEDGSYSVKGQGANEFGTFELVGTASKNSAVGNQTYSVHLCKQYVGPPPKQERKKKTIDEDKGSLILTTPRKRTKKVGSTSIKRGTPSSEAKSKSKSKSPKTTTPGSGRKKKVAKLHPDSGKRFGLGKPYLFCDVCFLEEDKEVGKTPFIKCIHCGLIAHSACYPQTSKVDSEGSFLCDVCTFKFHPSVNSANRTKRPSDGNIPSPEQPFPKEIDAKNDGRLHKESGDKSFDVYCQLCARRDVMGGMKPTDTNAWVHLACLMAAENSYYDESTAVDVDEQLKQNKKKLLQFQKATGITPTCEGCEGKCGMLLRCRNESEGKCCNRHLHALCAEILDRVRVVDHIKGRDVLSYKCTLHSYVGKDACGICKLGTKQNEMLDCDKCHQGYHMGCLNPPLNEIPDGDWLCDTCLSPSLKVDATAAAPLDVAMDVDVAAEVDAYASYPTHL